MTAESSFLVALFGTVFLLILVVWTGKRAKRALHIPLVVLTGAGLATAIFFALQVGEHYDLESAGAITPIHLTLARVATAAYLLPIVTGLVTLKSPRVRRLHGRLAILVVVLTLAAAVTGALMMAWAQRLPEVGS